MRIIHETALLQLFITCVLQFSFAVNQDREDLIEDSVRRLLGFKPGLRKETTPLAKNITLPPRYMMDLYEKYRSGQAHMQGNTVRSILPMRDNMGEADVLIFNLTGINSSERILQSKLYILKRRKPRNIKKRDQSHFRMKMGTLPNMTFHRYIDVSLSRQKSEWQSYDITNSVLHCRRVNQKKDSLLGITLEVKRSKNNYRLSPFRRLLRQSAQPFVLIFSEDEDNQAQHSSRNKSRNEFDTIQKLLTAKAEKGDYTDDSSHSEEESRVHSNMRKKRSFSKSDLIKRKRQHVDLKNTEAHSSEINTENGLIKIFDLHKGNKSNSFYLYHKILVKINRLKKEILPSHTPFHIFKSIHQQNGDSNSSKTSFSDRIQKVLLDFSNAVLTAFNDSKIFSYKNSKQGLREQLKLSKRSISNKFAYSEANKDSPDATANTFQAIDEKRSSNKSKPSRNRRKKQDSKKIKKKRRNRKLPFWWTKHEANLHSQDYKKMCQRRSLLVDFTKLGWGDWVMSPKSFNAHYCTGGCSFPHIKATNPSNHAALQSLIHALDLDSDIPAPCCVPSSTSPLTLLYFDENGSLVLKNYPDMIVNNCACR